MMKRWTMVSVSALVALLLLAAMGAVTTQPASANAREKIDPRVLADTENGQRAHVMVILKEQADLSGAAALASKEARTRFVVAALRETAARTQPAVTAQLDAMGVAYQRYWVANLIAVEGDRNVVDTLAQNPAVGRIEHNRAVRLLDPSKATTPDAGAMAGGPEWGVVRIGAPDVWAMGHTGTGIVVANQDTGHDWDHPALLNQYRGWNGATADHNYHWWDAIHQDIDGNGTNPCGFDSPEPCDDHGHGTHTLGTAVGDDGGSNQIGVAPGADWIGCRNMESGTGRPSTYTECFQFFLAPTDLQGNNPDPSLAPDVISNSWSCPLGPPPGGEDCVVDSMRQVVENVRAAGIVVAVSAGNSGPACSTVENPIGYHDASTTVGATDSSDTIASFSSRGPVLADGSGRRKPDISAPGVSVRSSIPGGGYGSSSGTSMAAPHVAGAAALIMDAIPSTRGNVDAIEALMFGSALPRTSAQGCGGDGPNEVPNNVYGYGRLDVLAAVQAGQGGAISLTKTVGLTPGVCGPDTGITVPANTSVNYCFTVENVGTVTYTLHSLVDDHLGALLADVPLTLSPGMSYTYSSSDTTTIILTESVTNTAVWTATIPGGPVTTDTASASVTVLPPTAIDLSALASAPTRAPWLALLPLGLAALAGGWLWRRRRP